MNNNIIMFWDHFGQIVLCNCDSNEAEGMFCRREYFEGKYFNKDSKDNDATRINDNQLCRWFGQTDKDQVWNLSLWIHQCFLPGKQPIEFNIDFFHISSRDVHILISITFDDSQQKKPTQRKYQHYWHSRKYVFYFCESPVKRSLFHFLHFI